MATKIKSQQVATNQVITATGRNILIEDLLRNAGDFAISEGQANHYRITINENLEAIEKGDVFKFQANFTNTGPATLQINNLEITDLETNEQVLQIPIKKNYNQDLFPNDILENQIVIVIFDGKNFQMLSPIGDPDNQHILLETAGENINGSQTPQAVCKIGNNYKDTLFVHQNGSHGNNQQPIRYNHEEIPVFQNMGDSSDNGLNEQSNRIRLSQSFTYTETPGTTTIEHITLWIRRIGNLGSNLILEIQEDDGNNRPNNITIENGASFQKSNGTIHENMEPVHFSFPNNPQINPNQKYHFVIKKIDNQGNTDRIDDRNYYQIARSNENRYPGHEANAYRINNNGNSWEPFGGDDIMFIMRLNINGENKIYLANSTSNIRRNFIGFTSENKQTNQDILIKPFGLQIKNFENLRQSTTYFLNANNGQISEHIPNENTDAIIPVGKTLNDQTIFIQDGTKNYFLEISGIDAQSRRQDFDFFIPSGFKPQTISISYAIRHNNNEQTCTYSAHFGTNYQKALGFQNYQLSSANIIVGGTTRGYGLGNPQGSSYIRIKSYFDNGFILTFHNQDNYRFELIRIIAAGN